MKKYLKKHIKILTVSLLLLCVTIGTCYALFSDQSNTLENTFTRGSVQTEIEEKEPIEVIDNYISKKPRIKNCGANDALIRARYTITPSSLVDTYNIGVTINSKFWTWDDTTNYYYYNYILESGEETEPLFTEVTGDVVADGKIRSELEGLEIAIYHESVQTSITINNTPITAVNGKYDGNTKMIWDNINDLNDNSQN